MTTKQAARLLGAEGGKIGGLSKSPKKIIAARRNLERARAKRWPNAERNKNAVAVAVEQATPIA